MILRLVLEGSLLLRAFHAVAARDAVANELNLAFRRGRRSGQAATLVEHESPELRVAEQTFYAIHQPHGVATGCEGCGQRHHRVARSVERHLESLATINLRHEIARLRSCQHLQRRTLEGSHDLRAREVETWPFGIHEAHAPDVLDVLVSGTHHATPQRQRLCLQRHGQQHGRHSRKYSFSHYCQWF